MSPHFSDSSRPDAIPCWCSKGHPFEVSRSQAGKTVTCPVVGCGVIVHIPRVRTRCVCGLLLVVGEDICPRCGALAGPTTPTFDRTPPPRSPTPAAQESESDVRLEKGSSDFELDLGADEEVASEDSSSEFELSLDADDDDSSSDFELEQLGEDSDSEFELTLDGADDLEMVGDAEEEGDIFETDLAVPPLDEESGSEAVALEDEADFEETSDFELDEEEPIVDEYEEEDADIAAATLPRRRTAAEDEPKAKASTVRRATVRYYSRMNPERVYPLLVMITKDMVEKARKKNTDQRTSRPFQVDTSIPIEIEPILPGCDCHPPKMVTRLKKGELTATFRVIPRVMGKVEGASVSIRQDHTTLAEIDLEVKVAQRTWTALCGVVTFLLPALSAVLEHFGLDFQTQQEQGFSLYLVLAHLVFNTFSPLTLTLALGAVTGLVWWRTRPVSRDVFWEIEPVTPAEKLQRIIAATKVKPDQAADDLMDLLKAFPDYQPARLFYAEWHYQLGNYSEALKGYEKGFKLGLASPAHYFRAAQAASRLKKNAQALGILQHADRVLPSGQMPGVTLFNMACYCVRLHQLDDAMGYLDRAVAAGYRKQESYRKDPDLDPLRNRADFQRFLARLENK